jgi:hypothetical protein
MKDAPTVTNPAGQSHNHHDLRFIFPILMRATPRISLRVVQHNSQLFSCYVQWNESELKGGETTQSGNYKNDRQCQCTV